MCGGEVVVDGLSAEPAGGVGLLALVFVLFSDCLHSAGVGSFGH